MTDDGGMLESAEQIQPIFLKVVTAMAMVDGKLKFSEIDGINAVFERHAGRPLNNGKSTRSPCPTMLTMFLCPLIWPDSRADSATK